MFSTKELFSIPFVSATWTDLKEHIKAVMASDTKELWVTANPEIIERSFTDPDLRTIVREKAVVFPDGVGVLWAARLLQVPLQDRLSGIDMIPLFNGYTVYLLGARSSIISKAAEVLRGQGFNVVGSFHGFFDDIEGKHIVEEIKRLQPQVLLVGLGMGRQEKWLAKHMQELPVKIALTVGGSFDVISGQKQRAPLIVQRAHLEWLYRLLQEPGRILRQFVLVKFVVRVLIQKLLFTQKPETRNKKQETRHS